MFAGWDGDFHSATHGLLTLDGGMKTSAAQVEKIRCGVSISHSDIINVDRATEITTAPQGSEGQ